MKTETKLLVSFLTVVGFTLAGCTADGNERASAETGTERGRSHFVRLTTQTVGEIGLTLVVAETRSIEGNMTVPSTLLPNQDLEAQVGSLVHGRVQKVLANVGDLVREGQELMRIEGLEVGEISSNFIKARAHLKYTEGNYQRQKTLLEQKVGSQRVFGEAQAEYEKALADFDAEDKKIHSIGLSDDEMLTLIDHGSTGKESHHGGMLPIKAPIGGIIVARNVVIGQLVDASTTAFRIINTTALWADGQVYEADLPKFAGRPEVTLTVAAFPGETFRGKVIYMSPLVDERTRTITIRASIPNPHGRLKPQMFGELHIPTGGSARGLLISAESVLIENGESYAFVATDDTTFERRRISLGTSFDSTVEVKGGITPGERVVTKGSFQLKAELMKETLEGGE
jgi:membrane fusion protein, heavy metal efflux system